MTQSHFPSDPVTAAGSTEDHQAIDRRVCAFVIALTALADFLFFGRIAGWTVAAFAFCLVMITAALNRHRLATRAGKILFGLNFGLIAALIEYPSFLAIGLFTAGLIGFLISEDDAIVSDALSYGDRLWRFIRRGIEQPIDDALSFIASRTGTSLLAEASLAGRNWVLPVVATSVFALLFSSANPVIAGWFDALLRGGFFELPPAARVAFWIVTAFFLWPVMTARPLPAAKPTTFASGHYFASSARLDCLFSSEAILRSLLIFNVLFGVQNLLDLRFLWTSGTLPEGLTFATYAHRGAYPLMASALLSAAFVLVALSPRREAQASPLARRLMYLWIAQNVFLVLSSISRTLLYIDVYAMTYLRFAAIVWMGIVAAGLIWLVVRFARGKTNRWLINVNAATAAGVLYVLAFVDTGAIVASYNVRHCSRFQPGSVVLDLGYLQEIGPSAYPALRWYIDKAGAAGSVETSVHTLSERLRIQLLASTLIWRRWTYRWHRYLQANPDSAPAPGSEGLSPSPAQAIP